MGQDEALKLGRTLEESRRHTIPVSTSATNALALRKATTSVADRKREQNLKICKIEELKQNYLLQVAQDSQTLSAQRRASRCERRNPVRARRQGTGTLIRKKISKSNFKLQNCFKNTKMRETNTLWTCTVLPKFQQKVTNQDFVHLNTMSPLEGQTERRWTVDLVGTIKQTNKQTKTWTNQTCEVQHMGHQDSSKKATSDSRG